MATDLKNTVDTTAEIIDFFDAALNGIVTVFNPKTGGHRTFKITTKEWPASKRWAARRVRELHLFVGNDNKRADHFLPFGEVKDDGTVKVWRRDRRQTKGKGKSVPRKFWDKIPSREDKEKLAAILADPERAMRSGLVFQQACHCRRCNNPLSNPESLAIGYGPECREHIEEGKTEVARLRQKK